MTKTKLTFLSLLAATLAISALTLRADDAAPAAPQADKSAPPYYPFTVGADVGILTGGGGSLSWRFMDNLGVRGGIDYFGYNRNGTIKDVSYDASVKLLTEPVTLDVFPWKTHSFHISLGVAFNENKVSGNASSGSFTLNGNPYSGTLNLVIKQELVDPYLSIGGNLFYFDSAHHWAMTGELGAFYTGNAKVSLTASNPTPPNGSQEAADVNSEQSKIQSYANDLKFFPALKLGFNFSF